ncbi:MAG: hypothetical protein HY598_00485 [Candidatus Omnitrophica bacterium]|nr:hypothetical protein [Candidatus Omnitrophota bacterium]
MPGLTPEDRRFLNERRKMVPRMRLAGWAFLVLALVMGGVLSMWMERVEQVILDPTERSQSAQLAEPTSTAREAKLVDEVKELDHALRDAIRLLLLIFIGLVVGFLLMGALLLVGSAWEQRQYLQAIDRLEEGRRLSG